MFNNSIAGVLSHPLYMMMKLSIFWASNELIILVMFLFSININISIGIGSVIVIVIVIVFVPTENVYGTSNAEKRL